MMQANPLSKLQTVIPKENDKGKTQLQLHFTENIISATGSGLFASRHANTTRTSQPEELFSGGRRDRESKTDQPDFNNQQV